MKSLHRLLADLNDQGLQCHPVPDFGAFCALVPVLKSIRVAVRHWCFRHFRYHPAGHLNNGTICASILREIRVFMNDRQGP